MLVVGKEASTLCTLHGIANCVKNGANKKICILQPMSASRSSVAHNYFRPSLRILFTAFLETKPQLWKLMSAISECCIGSNGSPLHPPLGSFQNKSVSSSFRSLPTYMLSLAKLKERGRPFFRGCKKGTASQDYPQERLFVIKDEKSL